VTNMKKITSSTGSASIKRIGHTASNSHGSNPNVKAKGRGTPRDLKI
jgi:hypothetical protein